MIWVDLRDRYGITQLIFDAERTDPQDYGIGQKARARIRDSSPRNRNRTGVEKPQYAYRGN